MSVTRDSWIGSAMSCVHGENKMTELHRLSKRPTSRRRRRRRGRRGSVGRRHWKGVEERVFLINLTL